MSIHDIAPLTPSDIILISVIIPVYQAELVGLHQCADAVLAQEGLSTNVELILVDNSPTFLLRDHFKEKLGVLVINETKIGSYAARNSGVRAARGSILAFTDADCIPDKNWLKNGFETLNGNPPFDYVAGNIQNLFRIPGSPNLFEHYDSLFYLKQEWYLKEEHYAATANLITRRSVFETASIFDEMRLSGGDREWGKRVWRSGIPQGFSPEAIIFHRARSTFFELTKKIRRICGGDCQSTQEKQPLGLIDLLKGLWKDGRWKFRVVRKNTVLIGRLQIYFCFSLIVGLQTVYLFEYLRLRMGGNPRR